MPLIFFMYIFKIYYVYIQERKTEKEEEKMSQALSVKRIN